VSVADALEVLGRDALDGFAIQQSTLRDEALVGALVVQVGQDFLIPQDAFEALEALVGQDSDFVAKVLLELRNVFSFDLLGALVLFLSLAAEDTDVDNRAFDARGARERGVANIASLLTEDGAEQLLFRSELRLALRRDLADQNVAMADLGTDADNAALVQIAQGMLRDVGNITRDFFRSELRVASFDFKLLDVNRGVVIVLHKTFADQDRVLEVVTAPGHESHQHVTSEGELALFCARTVRDNLSLQHALTFTHNRLLVDAGVLVRA